MRHFQFPVIPSSVSPNFAIILSMGMFFSPFAYALTSGVYEYELANSGAAVTITQYNGPDGVVQIPPSLAGLPVTGLGQQAFFSGNSTKFIISATVASIGVDAFSQNKSLLTIDVDPANPYFSSVAGVLFNKQQTWLIEYPEGKSGSYAIPDGVTGIGTQAFASCFLLNQLTIPGSVVLIEDDSFYHTRGLSKFVVSGLNSSFSSAGGVLFSKDQTVILKFPGGMTGRYSIPPTVTRIGTGAFKDCNMLAGISIPAGVTEIGSSAFASCHRLEDLTLPDSIVTIGSFAFGYCNGLTKIVIPNQVTDLGDETFWGCDALESVVIPNSIQKIGKGAFYACNALKRVSLGKGVTSIGDSAFRDCAGLTTIKLPESVTMIEGFAFSSCSLTSVTIPSQVTVIGGGAFGISDGFSGGNTVGTLRSVNFLGDAPNMGPGVFSDAAKGFTIFYDAGKNGFSSPKWKGYLATPVSVEISVQQPLGSDLVDGKARKSFGSVNIGESGRLKTFTVKNIGADTLTGLGITITGSHRRDFIVAKPVERSLDRGESTQFRITFRPGGKGTRNAVLHLKSNDLSENPFDIELTGMGVR